jgi:hypothetical protein
VSTQTVAEALPSLRCRKAQWWGTGMPAGTCNKPAYGAARKDSEWPWVNPACPAHGGPKPYIDVVFDGPPGHESGRFIEAEAPDGSSVNFGRWVQRDDGYWVLRIDADE